MIKFSHKIHLWLSVPFGVFITLICFSGAMLIFEPEITRAVNPGVYYVNDEKDSPMPMEQLMETVKASLPDGVSISEVTVFTDKSRTYQVALSKPRRTSVFINQYSGEITGRYERLAFFRTMSRLHRCLLDSANPNSDGMMVGKTLVGISTLIFIITLISGIVIWWPRVRQGFFHSLSIPFSKGWNGFWKGLHVGGGMYALLFVLAMALTGLTWSFDWYRAAFYAVCGVEHTPLNFGQSKMVGNKGDNHQKCPLGREKCDAESGCGNRGECAVWQGYHDGIDLGENTHNSEFSRWQQVYNQLKSENPYAPQITVGSGTASVTLGIIGNSWAANRYDFNLLSGEITPSSMYATANSSDKLRGWTYAIHTGEVGGIITRIIWFISALVGASLPLTGYYIWIRRVRKRHNDYHNTHA